MSRVSTDSNDVYRSVGVILPVLFGSFGVSLVSALTLKSDPSTNSSEVDASKS